ncbi:hypothetical protein AC249_AIPGENE26919 [Exaiptasia diaphana]|nr:hypothetical protein AC249_AIPGENE26919 [Exaiptasia diaphana]
MNYGDITAIPQVKRRLFETPVGERSKSPRKKKKKIKYTSSPGKRNFVFTNKNSEQTVRYHKWSDEEDKALVEFVSIAQTDPCYNWQGNQSPWPGFRTKHFFWSDAANHIKESTTSTFLLSNTRVRSRVVNSLRQRFKTVQEAEEHLGLSLTHYLGDLDPKPVPSRLGPGVHKFTQTKQEEHPVENDYRTRSDEEFINQLTDDEAVKLANSLFLKLATRRGIDTNPADFVRLSLDAMVIFQQKQKKNLVYQFSRIIAKSLLPLNRMPFGLISYQIQFFNCTNIMQISVPADYATWHETMCAEFPTRFNKLFRGPMWSSVPIAEQKDPSTARVNVAAPSINWVEKRTAKSEFSEKPELQV